MVRDPMERYGKGHPWSETQVCDKGEKSGEQTFFVLNKGGTAYTLKFTSLI